MGTRYNNLFTNPSFEATSDTVEARRNYAPNPSPANAAYWNATGGATLSYTTAEKHLGTGSIQVVTSGATGDGGYSYNYRTIPTGEAWSFGVWVKAPIGVGLYLFTRFTDGSSLDVPFTGTGDWQFVSASTTNSGASGTNVMFGVRAGGGGFTGTFYFAEMLVEKSSTLGDYFDGSTSPDTDLPEAWVGTPNASESTLSKTTVAAVTSTTAYQSAKWAIQGTKSLYVPTGGTATVTLAASSTAVVVARYPGQVLTVGSASETSAVTDQTMKATGLASVTLGPGYWDTLLIVEGTYAGEYFDGNTDLEPGLNPFWSGTPDSSTSHLWGLPVL